MNANRSMMQPHRLLKKVHLRLLPRTQIDRKAVQLNRHLMRRRTDVGFMRAKLARPCPDAREHVAVKSLHPRDSERRRATRRSLREILHHDLAYAFRLSGVERGLRGHASQPQPREIVEPRFTLAPTAQISRSSFAMLNAGLRFTWTRLPTFSPCTAWASLGST